MLYEQWLTVARAHRDRVALWDGATRREWTFAQLAAEAESAPQAKGGLLVTDATGPRFLMDILRGWRDRQVVIPLEPGQSAPKLPQPPPDGVVHLKTTSATTAAPRLIAFTAAQLGADCDQVVRTMGLELPNVGAISLAHSYGFSNLVLPLLLRGIPLLLAESALPESVRAAIEQSPSVTLASVPALWQAWHQAGILGPRIRIAISAGAPLPLPLERAVFESAGIKIHNFYGSSECGGIAYDRSPTPRTEASLAGTPMKDVRVEVTDTGCACVRSAAVGYGYWPNPDPALADGVFRTSDLAELREGAVHLLGRAGDRINVAGRKVIPEVVERALASHPAVKDCLVFGVPSTDVRNEHIVACVSACAALTPEELAGYMQDRLPGWQVPREWWMVDSLEVNDRGKRSRAAWRDRYLRDHHPQAP